MKQAITITCAILALALLLAGCGKVATENSEIESTIESSKIELLKDDDFRHRGYEDVLAEYQCYLNLVFSPNVDAYEESLTADPRYIHLSETTRYMLNSFSMRLETLEEGNLGQVIDKDKKSELGYAFKDLNNNGHDELVLLSKDGKIFAVYSNPFSYVQGLAESADRVHIAITKDGHILQQDNASVRKYRLSNGDQGLILLDGVEFNHGVNLTSDNRRGEFYRYQNEYEKENITGDEYDVLIKELFADAYHDEEKYILRSTYKLDFTPLFKE